MADFIIPGYGPIQISQESTSTQVKEEYEKWMSIIKDIFNKDESEWTTSDYSQLLQALQNLQKLAQEGERNVTGSTSYLTTDMANNLKAVIELLSEAGITSNSSLSPDQGLIAMATLKSWKSEKGVTFSLVLSNAVGDLKNADKNLQMMLADFVLGALTSYDKSLSDLAEQLKINLKIATTLAKLQELRNRVTGAPSDSTVDPNKKPSPTPPTVNLTDDDVKNLLIYRQELKDEIADLKAKGGDTKDLEQVLNDLNGVFGSGDSIYGGSDQIPDVTQWGDEQWQNFFGKDKDGNSLPSGPSDWYHFMTKEGGEGKVESWFSDNLNQTGGSAGNYQDHLQNAINTVESTNDTQKAHLQALQTTSSQITDMAAALIDAISKLIQKFATGIGQS